MVQVHVNHNTCVKKGSTVYLQDIIPYLVLHQHSRKARPGAQQALPAGATSANGDAENGQRGSSDSLERVDSMLPPTSVAGAAPWQPPVTARIQWENMLDREPSCWLHAC